MNDKVTFTIDGRQVTGRKDQTILEAAEDAGIYIPRLCWARDLAPGGSCRVCTVMVNGRAQASCRQPVAEGIMVENDTDRMNAYRRDLIDMLFVEGNHFCMFCEKSGNCELQATAYRLGILAPKYPYLFPKREVDATHPDVLIDQNRCILCGRCVRASRQLDRKNVFQFVGRGHRKKVGFNAEEALGDTDLKVTDKAVRLCPVGAILRKHTGYQIPVGQRLYDWRPIGSNVEAEKHKSS